MNTQLKRRGLGHAGTHLSLRKSRHLLAEVGRRLRVVLDNVGDAVVEVDENGLIVEWNRHSENVFGWSRSQARRKPLFDLILQDSYRESHRHELDRLLSIQGEPLPEGALEVLACDASGMEIPLRVIADVIKVGDAFHYFIFFKEFTQAGHITGSKRRSWDQEAHHSTAA